MNFAAAEARKREGDEAFSSSAFRSGPRKGDGSEDRAAAVTHRAWPPCSTPADKQQQAVLMSIASGAEAGGASTAAWSAAAATSLVSLSSAAAPPSPHPLPTPFSLPPFPRSARVVLKLRAIGRPRLDGSRCYIPVLVTSNGQTERELRCTTQQARLYDVPVDNEGKLVVGGDEGLDLKIPTPGKDVVWRVLQEGDPVATGSAGQPGGGANLSGSFAPAPGGGKLKSKKKSNAFGKPFSPGPSAPADDSLRRKFDELKRTVEEQGRAIAKEKQLRAQLAEQLDHERSVREELQDFTEQTLIAVQSQIQDLKRRVGSGNAGSSKDDRDRESDATAYEEVASFRRNSTSPARPGDMDRLRRKVEAQESEISHLKHMLDSSRSQQHLASPPLTPYSAPPMGYPPPLYPQPPPGMQIMPMDYSSPVRGPDAGYRPPMMVGGPPGPPPPMQAQGGSHGDLNFYSLQGGNHPRVR